MIHLFGIRHHGPGSARSVLSALTSLQPDIILLEGPVEAEAILPFAANPAMKPPVAVLVYGSVAEEAEPRAAFFRLLNFLLNGKRYNMAYNVTCLYVLLIYLKPII
jgi:hypothetical protein